MALAWQDGQFAEKNSIRINPADFGFSRGMAAYEFGRIYGGAPFRLDDHLERLEHGARTLGISFAWKRTDIVAVVQKLITENKFPHSVIKFYLTIGECAQPSTGGLAACVDFTPHLFVMEDEVKPLHPEAPRGLDIHRRGMKVKTVPFARQMPEVKSINYAPGFVAVIEARKQGWEDILFTHPDDYVTETTIGNFFAVIDGALCTPDEGMMYGVTRKVLLELTAKIGVPVVLRRIAPAELARATEAFSTGSFVEMMPVCQIDGHTLPATTEGPVFKKLRAAFTACITESSQAAARHRASA
jgi:branched-subunit amino acid aminotransferase/4-amino-4-deoxychorismate lyase